MIRPVAERWRGSIHWPVLVVPLLALLVTAPLFGKPSCGHDYDFHLQSWIDAADQIRHGTLLPHWTYSAAYGAGEPRFVFYPPLSWTLGAVLMLLLPSGVVPAAMTWLALTLAGWGMLALARRFTGSGGALLAAAVYLTNPYMLFTAYERTAFAELLAAAWMPWLLRAALDKRPQWWSVAWPVALLWLTNAPAAVMGTYTLVAVVLLRMGWRGVVEWRERGAAFPWGIWLREEAGLVAPVTGGLVLGLAMVSFYLLPAAWERRDVQIAMAVIPGMRVEDNFLFGHTGDGPHDAVLRTASWIALGLAGAILVLLAFSWRQRGRAQGEVAGHERLAMLGSLTVLLMVLLTKASLPLWHLLPELAFLQFPWRFASVLGCVFGVAVAVTIGRRRFPLAISVLVGAAACVAGMWASQQNFRMGCEVFELPANSVALYAGHHGVVPTDEYTPTDADNDQQRWDEPGWWLAGEANDPGPNTVTNPAATIVNYDVPPTLEQTVSGRAPMRLQLQLARPEDLILNLRAYPAWVATVNGGPARWLQRDDGLIALALPAGADVVEVHWRRLPDVWAGDALSLCAFAVAGVWGFRSRRIEGQE